MEHSFYMWLHTECLKSAVNIECVSSKNVNERLCDTHKDLTDCGNYIHQSTILGINNFSRIGPQNKCQVYFLISFLIILPNYVINFKSNDLFSRMERFCKWGWGCWGSGSLEQNRMCLYMVEPFNLWFNFTFPNKSVFKKKLHF